MPAWRSSSARARIALRAAATVLGLALILWASVPADAFRGGGGFRGGGFRGGGFQRGSSFRGGGAARRAFRSSPRGRTVHRANVAPRASSNHHGLMHPRATLPHPASRLPTHVPRVTTLPPHPQGTIPHWTPRGPVGGNLPPRVTTRLPRGPRVQVFGDQMMPSPDPSPTDPPPANDPPPDNSLPLFPPLFPQTTGQAVPPPPSVPPPPQLPWLGSQFTRGPPPDPAGCDQAMFMLDSLSEAQTEVQKQISDINLSTQYSTEQAAAAIAPLQTMVNNYVASSINWLGKARAACGFL